MEIDQQQRASRTGERWHLSLIALVLAIGLVSCASERDVAIEMARAHSEIDAGYLYFIDPGGSSDRAPEWFRALEHFTRPSAGCWLHGQVSESDSKDKTAQVLEKITLLEAHEVFRATLNLYDRGRPGGRNHYADALRCYVDRTTGARPGGVFVMSVVEPHTSSDTARGFNIEMFKRLAEEYTVFAESHVSF